ncbi:MAG: hypothetical protein COB53_12290 [Elusimicrobia bacterium]|nr:MAG: hypothetical protein COB53_12290 [Elusimicrobiota bacterium]
MRFFLIVTLVLPFAVGGCAKPDPSIGLELLSAKPPTRLRLNEVLEFKPAEGHYFNLKAPQNCAEFDFQTKSPRVLRCQITEPGTHAIALSVCDDKATYCRFAKFPVIADAPKGWKAGKSVRKATHAAPKGVRHPIPGFVDNDPEKALAMAKKDGKLLLIDFYGIWCPPCNMLDEYVYKEKKFQDASSDLVRVALDADAPLSWDWKAKFKVGGYPTVIIADAELNEIGRIVGYRPVGSYLKWMSEQKALRDEPIEKALKAELTLARKRRLGEWRYNRREYTEAIKLLEGVKDKDLLETYWVAKQKKAAKEKEKTAENEALKVLIEKFPDSISYAGRVLSYAEVDKKYASSRFDSVLANLKRWRNSPKLDATGYEEGDLYDLEADIWAERGDEKKKIVAYTKASEYYKTLAAKSSLLVARAANMSRAYFLRVSGDVEGAKKLYEALASAYSNEFTFNYSYASTLRKLKEFDKAYGFIKKAEANAYGDNWLRAIHLKAKIEIALKRPSDAIKTLELGLAEAVIPSNTDVRTYRYVERLRNLLTDLESGKKAA